MEAENISTPLPVQSALLHEPMILNGANLKTDLDPEKRTGLKLAFDTDNRELHVWWKGRVKFVKNWANIEPMDLNEWGLKEPEIEYKKAPIQQAGQVNHAIQAQVSTPMSHVFEPLPGLIGQSKVR